jgi:hypothetical protein
MANGMVSIMRSDVSMRTSRGVNQLNQSYLMS